MNLPAVQDGFSIMPYVLIAGSGLLLLIILGVVIARRRAGAADLS